MEPTDRSAINTAKPEVRCGSCGGKCRVGYDPIYKRGARVIHCNSGFRGRGHCAWSSMNPARVDPSWYWKLRVRLGI